MAFLFAEDHVLEIRGVTVRSGQRNVLEHVDLSVARGDVIALMGPKGSGKTALLNCVAGRLRPSRGSVRVFGRDPANDPAVLSRLGYAGQADELPGWMSVGQLLDHTSAFYHCWDAGLVESLLRTFDLRRGDEVRDLSEAKRVAAELLLALAFRPELLVCDDIGARLDRDTRNSLLRPIMPRIQGEGGTVVFSTHDFDQAERAADWIVEMDRGRVVRRRRGTWEEARPPRTA